MMGVTLGPRRREAWDSAQSPGEDAALRRGFQSGQRWWERAADVDQRPAWNQEGTGEWDPG